jgi:hypothetical protein
MARAVSRRHKLRRAARIRPFRQVRRNNWQYFFAADGSSTSIEQKAEVHLPMPELSNSTNLLRGCGVIYRRRRHRLPLSRIIFNHFYE